MEVYTSTMDYHTGFSFNEENLLGNDDFKNGLDDEPYRDPKPAPYMPDLDKRVDPADVSLVNSQQEAAPKESHDESFTSSNAPADAKEDKKEIPAVEQVTYFENPGDSDAHDNDHISELQRFSPTFMKVTTPDLRIKTDPLKKKEIVESVINSRTTQTSPPQISGRPVSPPLSPVSSNPTSAVTESAKFLRGNNTPGSDSGLSGDGDSASRTIAYVANVPKTEAAQVSNVAYCRPPTFNQSATNHYIPNVPNLIPPPVQPSTQPIVMLGQQPVYWDGVNTEQFQNNFIPPQYTFNPVNPTPQPAPMPQMPQVNMPYVQPVYIGQVPGPAKEEAYFRPPQSVNRYSSSSSNHHLDPRRRRFEEPSRSSRSRTTERYDSVKELLVQENEMLRDAIRRLKKRVENVGEKEQLLEENHHLRRELDHYRRKDRYSKHS